MSDNETKPYSLRHMPTDLRERVKVVVKPVSDERKGRVSMEAFMIEAIETATAEAEKKYGIKKK